MQDFTKPKDPSPEATGGYEGLESNGVAAVGATGRLETADLPRGSVSSAETSAASGNGASSAQAGRDSCALSPPPRKPPTSIKAGSIDDVKEWVWALLRKADKEPDPEKRFALLEEAREHARRVRWHGWASSRWAISFAGVCMGAAAAMLYLWLFPRVSWRVFEQTDRDGYEFVLQRVVNGHVLLPELRRFCQGPKEIRPRFEIGMTLASLKFEERGECVSIAGDDLGYVIERGADHKPKLARNCYSPADDIPNVCFGRPQFE